MISDFISSYLIKLVVEKQEYLWFPGDTDTTAEVAVQFWGKTAYKFMVKDQARMDAYRRVICQHVKDKVVLEVGTGALAPLSRMCVEGGAKKVYAIEANTKAAKEAIQGLRADGLDKKIEIFSGFSYNIGIPEKAEVLIHEVVGNMGKDEGMARIVHDAKKRLLQDNAFFIPHDCTVDVVPVGHTLAPVPLPMRIFERLYRAQKPNVRKIYIWNFPEQDFLSDPLEYESIVFSTNFSLEDTRELKFNITRESSFSGFLFWNKIAVGQDDILTCLKGTHWPATYIPVCEERVQLLPDDVIVLRTYQNMRVHPTYQFETSIIRKSEEISLPVIQF